MLKSLPPLQGLAFRVVNITHRGSPDAGILPFQGYAFD